MPGALPYATAKAAIEGLTRALAVEYGPHGIRVNAVALGSVATERYAEYWPARPDAPRRSRPRWPGCIRSAGWPGRGGGRRGRAACCRPTPSFVTGAIVPVDGGRAVLGHDPEPPTA